MGWPVGAVRKKCARAPLAAPDNICDGLALKLTTTVVCSWPSGPLVHAFAGGSPGKYQRTTGKCPNCAISGRHVCQLADSPNNGAEQACALCRAW